MEQFTRNFFSELDVFVTIHILTQNIVTSEKMIIIVFDIITRPGALDIFYELGIKYINLVIFI